jgi:molybdenum cofactor cytidylyltransferase
MGAFKLLLPWQGHTVIRQVVMTLAEAGLDDVLVVTGYRAADLAPALAGTIARTVVNQDFEKGMLTSIQAGLAALSAERPRKPAALLCLGDQPQIQAGLVRAILAAGAAHDWASIVVPSFAGRAGHPILLPQGRWPEVLATEEPLRAVMAAHRDSTVYLPVAGPAMLADLDTPADYQSMIAGDPERGWPQAEGESGEAGKSGARELGDGD